MSTLEIPTTLPVSSLSVSSVSLFQRCPEKWRRRYLENEYEGPKAAAMILGSAVGAAEGHAYQHQIDDGERPPTAQVLDVFVDEWAERTEREEIAWGADSPGTLKDTGVAAVKAYDLVVAPSVTPVSVERRFELQLAGVEWQFTGYFDLEDDEGLVRDLKVRGRRMSAADAQADPQPTAYLLARRSEGNPAAGFAFDTMIKTKTPYAEVLLTDRSDVQLNTFAHRLYDVAAEINWRVETGNWAGAPPGSWWCGSEKSCGYWPRCPYGGLA
jgi:hypothetical protein